MMLSTLKSTSAMEMEIENSEIPKADNIVTTSSSEISEQPLLGSVTTFNNVEGSEVKSQQIRSSARVFKKMKLDLTTPLITEKPEKKEDVKQDIKKCYRPLWTSDDKSIFFEALNEFGKDFESIQLYISTKLKKKGIPEHLIKTKDQVRHLYYRSHHKISKYVKFADGIKKVVQELYGLINYGELRKKIGSVSEKSLLKLNELIYKGFTVLRIKGKTLRIKTPMCRALRRLNQLDENFDEIQLPNKITVELRPKDMTSFLRVQAMAQNPRLKTILPLQKRLSNLISCVSKRWKSVDARNYDKALISSNVITNDCIPSSVISEEKKKLLTPALRITPPADYKIEIPSINLSEYITRQSICLNSYESRHGITNNECAFFNYNHFKIMNKNSSKKGCRLRTDSVSDKSEKSPQKIVIQTDENDTYEVTENDSNPLIQSEVQECEDDTLKVKLEKKDVDMVNEQKQIKINNIRRGWIECDSESLTVGEIYLMFGSDSKLILEYSWDQHLKINKAEDELTAEHAESTLDSNDLSNDFTKNLDLSVSLSKLLSVAKLHYRKNIIKCPCGHVCGVKNNVQLKRAMESKIRKILTDIDKCADETDDKITPEENIFENDPSFVAPPVYLQPNIQLSPASYFHQPNSPVIHLVSQLDSIKRLTPRYCNRRGRRSRTKPVVVERKLPLLPNRLESGHQIVRMNIISQEDSKDVILGEQSLFHTKNIIKSDHHNIFINQDQINTSKTVFLEASRCSRDIKSLNDNEVELHLINENTIITAPSSPSRILRESDNQWINSEVADYSLSSLLGHLESPIKSNSVSVNITNDDSRLSQDVDAQLQSLLTESSVDFSANFADLAAQVTNEVKK